MSDAATYTIAANLRWFAIVYAAVTTAAVIVFIVAQSYGITIPSSGLNIGIFIGAVYAAGYRFAQKTNGDWTGAQRNALALGYTVISIAVSAVLVAAIVAIDPATGAALASMLSEVGAIFAVILLVIAVISYAAARFSLMMVARRRGSK